MSSPEIIHPKIITGARRKAMDFQCRFMYAYEIVDGRQLLVFLRCCFRRVGAENHEEFVNSPWEAQRQQRRRRWR
jgi:hypothetical protein